MHEQKINLIGRARRARSGGDNLERDVLVRHEVPRAPHRAESPLADFLLDFVLAQFWIALGLEAVHQGVYSWLCILLWLRVVQKAQTSQTQMGGNLERNSNFRTLNFVAHRTVLGLLVAPLAEL